jgi:hypothetical protein
MKWATPAYVKVLQNASKDYRNAEDEDEREGVVKVVRSDIKIIAEKNNMEAPSGLTKVFQDFYLLNN